MWKAEFFAPLIGFLGQSDNCRADYSLRLRYASMRRETTCVGCECGFWGFKMVACSECWSREGGFPPATFEGTLQHAGVRLREGLLLLEAAEPCYIDVRSLAGDTALHRASLWGCHKAVEMLLKAGADPQLVNDKGLTPKDVICAQPCAPHGHRREIEDAFATC